jgi:hypothetical protein
VQISQPEQKAFSGKHFPFWQEPHSKPQSACPQHSAQTMVFVKGLQQLISPSGHTC